jgi:hypothetical protein
MDLIQAQRGQRVPRTRAERAELARELRALDRMKTDDLVDKHFELFGYATKSRNKPGLIRRLYHRVQEIQEGRELSEEARSVIKTLSQEVSVADGRAKRPAKKTEDAPRDPRLPGVGTVLAKRHKGREYEVTVLKDGFEYDGAIFKTLSAVAKEITGRHWNGFIFFGLDTRKPKKTGASR